MYQVTSFSNALQANRLNAKTDYPQWVIEPSDPERFEIARHVSNTRCLRDNFTTIDYPDPYRHAVVVENPQPGYVILTRIYSHGNGWREEGFAILQFDGLEWWPVPHCHRIVVEQDLTLTVVVGEAVYIKCFGRERSFVPHVLDFWGGLLDIAGLITIDNRLRIYPKIEAALKWLKKVRGALDKVHSSSFDQVEQFLREAMSGYISQGK